MRGFLHFTGISSFTPLLTGTLNPKGKERMKPIEIELCLGTTCYVLGSSELQELAETLPLRWRGRVEIRPAVCLDLCKDRTLGSAPFVRIDGVPYAEMTLEKLYAVVDRLLDSPERP